MKNILLIIIALAAMLLSCAFSGCVSVNNGSSLNQLGGRSHIKGSGKLVTRMSEIADFQAINASRAVQVVVCDTTDRVVITADDNLIDYVGTVVSQNVLYVSIDDSVKNFANANAHVVVVVPIGDKLTMLSASSAARIATAKAIQAEKIKISASSAAKIDAAIRAATCIIAASSAANVQVAVVADKCVADGSSAARINLSGMADQFEADLSSAARMDAESLKTRACEVEVSSGSKAYVNSSEYLKAEASSGAFIGYTGSCRTDISTSSGGRVRHQ